MRLSESESRNVTKSCIVKHFGISACNGRRKGESEEGGRERKRARCSKNNRLDCRLNLLLPRVVRHAIAAPRRALTGKRIYTRLRDEGTAGEKERSSGSRGRSQFAVSIGASVFFYAVTSHNRTATGFRRTISIDATSSRQMIPDAPVDSTASDTWEEEEREGDEKNETDAGVDIAIFVAVGRRKRSLKRPRRNVIDSSSAESAIRCAAELNAGLENNIYARARSAAQ